MTRRTIDIGDFQVYAHRIWARQWLVLTAGDFAAGEYNAMTVGWGSFGTMWGKPFAQVVVRPGRHTLKFMEEFPTFTLSAFSDDYRQALQMIGGMSGRDGDKIAAANLRPMAATVVAAPPSRRPSWSSSAARCTGRTWSRRIFWTPRSKKPTPPRITTASTSARSPR